MTRRAPNPPAAIAAGHEEIRMTTGSELAVPPNISRAQYIIDLFNFERTKALLQKRKKPGTKRAADAILDALVAWDVETGGANTHQLSVKYNALLDGA
jgi:hypothetical protein